MTSTPRGQSPPEGVVMPNQNLSENEPGIEVPSHETDRFAR